MKNGNEVAAHVVGAFEALGIDYFLAGSFSSNFYGIPRSTKDADFVAVLGADRVRLLRNQLGPEFVMDPQPSFETVTGTFRETLRLPSLAFEVEIFHLSQDAHDQARFQRRRRVRDELIGRDIYLPTAEDVIITKLRWAKGAGRAKDIEDVRDVIAVQGDTLDWSYTHEWCDAHGTRALLDGIRTSIPPL